MQLLNFGAFTYVPDPDEVVQAVEIGETVMHYAIELYAWCGILITAPPELLKGNVHQSIELGNTSWIRSHGGKLRLTHPPSAS